MDIISKLPDSIRNCIVSFLSMEDAVCTSALSKQWRNVCSSLPRFQFRQHCFVRNTNMRYDFGDFVDQTICRHDGSSIQEFSLHMEDDFYEDGRTVSWIIFAIKHKVKDLTIDIPKYNSLPDCLFTCESLINLNLWGVTLNTPAELKFPNLEFLGLDDVKFTGNTGNQTNQLIVNCILLKHLTIFCSSWKNTDDLIIHAPNLDTLSVISCNAHNVELHCPNLKEITYYGHPPVINPKSLLSLCSVDFGCPSSFIPTITSAQNVVSRQGVSKIVMGLSNVVSLSLDHLCFEILRSNEDILSNQALSFNRLKILSVSMFANENNVHFMPFLLKICPNLNLLSLFFEERDEHTDVLNMGGYWHQQKLSDGDSLESLEILHIVDFEGSSYEFYLIGHLLENAKILKEVEITHSKKFDEDGPQVRSITEKMTQIIAISPYVNNIQVYAPTRSGDL